MDTTALTIATRGYICKADRPPDVRDRLIATLAECNRDQREARRQLHALVDNLAAENRHLRAALARRDAAIGRRRPRRIDG